MVNLTEKALLSNKNAQTNSAGGHLSVNSKIRQIISIFKPNPPRSPKNNTLYGTVF